MRYLPIQELEDKMILGQDLFDSEGRMLLAGDEELSSDHIRSLKEMGFHGVYIKDNISADIEFKQLMKPEIRSRALSMVHNLFMGKEEGVIEREQQLMELVVDVVEEILGNGDIMYNMMDLKAYDDYTFYHSVNVAVLSAVIGVRYGMEEEELRILTMAALLHDIGKRFLEDDILNAKRPLREEERHIMLQHPKLGYEFLTKHYNFTPEVATAVLEHHECYNGEGYPMRKSGLEISIFARIIKLADVFDAMTSKRPYRDMLPPSDAIEYIMAMCGSEFDPKLVEVFLKWVAVYPVGCEVVLSDDRHAIVTKNFPNFVLRPVVKLLETGEIINLNQDRDARNITIVRLVV